MKRPLQAIDLLYDTVFYDETDGVAGTAWPTGTPQVPSDVIADVIAICTARNLHVISVHGGVTLGDTMEHYCFIGYEHEDIADTLVLNGQDVDGSHIEGMIVTGAQGGAGYLTLVRCIAFVVTDFQGRMNNCSFWAGLCSFRDAGQIDLVDCDSIYGVVTITVQAPTRASIKNWQGNLILTAQDGGACFVRGFKGSLEIDAMIAGTLSVYANGADITINGDCTGGTINIWGNATITGAGGGVVINDYTPEAGLQQVYDIVNAMLTLQETGGTLLTDGNEQYVYVNDSPLGVYRPVTVAINLDNMIATEQIVVREYYRINPDGDMELKDVMTYDGVDGGLGDSRKLININMEPNRYGCAVTLEMTAYDTAYKTFDWEVFPEE